MKEIDQWTSFTNAYLKKTQEGEKWWLKWKDVELWEYTGDGNPQTIINKIRENDYKIKSLFVLLKMDVPLNCHKVNDGFRIGAVAASNTKQFLCQPANLI